MRKFILAIAIVTAGCNGAQAQIAPYFDETTGQLTIPDLQMNGKVYYARLVLTDAANRSFKEEALQDITPPADLPSDINARGPGLYGKWRFEDGDLRSLYILFNLDGTYEHFVEAVLSPDCKTGVERGTWQWDRTTGLFLRTVTEDQNGVCGFSHPQDGMQYRLFVRSNAELQIVDGKNQYDPDNFDFSMVSPP